MEIWKDVCGYEGFYMVSTLGQVKSLDRQCKYRNQKGRVLVQAYRQGYKTVSISVAGRKKTVPVHKMVAQAFISNENKLPEINHIDSDRANNKVGNLEWCNRSHNIQHSYDIGGRVRVRRPKSFNEDTYEPLCELRKLKSKLRWGDMNKIAQFLQLDYSLVWSAFNKTPHSYRLIPTIMEGTIKYLELKTK